MESDSSKKKKLSYGVEIFRFKSRSYFFQKGTSENGIIVWDRRRFLQVLPITVAGLMIKSEKSPPHKKMLSLEKADWWEKIEN